LEQIGDRTLLKQTKQLATLQLGKGLGTHKNQICVPVSKPKSKSELCGERQEEEAQCCPAFGDGAYSYERPILREDRWCESRETVLRKDRSTLDLKHNPRESPKNAEATSYWILYCTAMKDQTPDKLKQNITKKTCTTSDQYRNKGKYSIGAYKTERVCSCQYFIEIRLYRDSDTRQNKPEYVRDSKISQGTKGLVKEITKAAQAILTWRLKS